MVEATWTALPSDLQGLLRCALSRALFENKDLRLAGTRYLCDGLEAWGTAPLYLLGEEQAAHFPDLQHAGWPSGPAVLARMGVTRERLADQWESQKQGWHEEAALPDELMLAFVPRELWLVFGRLIVDGPDLAAKRLAAAIDRMEATPIRATKARPEGGTLSGATVRQRSDRVMSLFSILVRLRTDGLRSTHLDAWTHVPSRPDIAGEFIVETDRTAPSRRLCRLVFAAYRADVLGRLGCSTVEELPNRIRSMSRSQVRNAGAARSLRTLAMIVIMLTTGIRRQAMMRIRRGDFQVARICWDGIGRPALGVRPSKGKPWDQVFFKAIARPAGCIIEAWCLLAELQSGQSLAGGDPLFPGRLTEPRRAMEVTALTVFFSGHVPSGAVRRRCPQRAAFPRYIDTVDSIGRYRGPFSARECTGYSPHALRHAADQLVEHGAPRYLADLGENRMTGSIIVKAMCNHSMIEDPMLYKDFGNPQGLERLCCMGAEIAWAVLTTDAGARMAHDHERIEAALRKRAALEAELESIRDRISAARIRAERIAHADPASVTHEDWLRSHNLRASVDLLMEERFETQDALRELDREIESLQHDAVRKVAVPDEVADNELVVDVAALQMAIDGTSNVNGTRRRRRRRWLTPAEFAEVAGVSVSEVKRWLAGTYSVRHRGPLPWPPDVVPVDWISAKRRRILIDGVNPEFLADPERAERLERLLAEPGTSGSQSGNDRTRSGQTAD